MRANRLVLFSAQRLFTHRIVNNAVCPYAPMPSGLPVVWYSQHSDAIVSRNAIDTTSQRHAVRLYKPSQFSYVYVVALQPTTPL